ncbi:DUF418 domain-containing protein [Corynebacterium tapiri]|uniref:DUF418 domain-containing protein n=1 Tax=Corynebacterium tapiri TaxID=1448266 RepID=A0A5C4U8M1_9CORY|nr:DUF418 domain-containing protein [Corynebacterium tapiri]TNM00517.1 DUF418 domain-containing protein [Corynebacterium tapiri]
MSNTPTRLVSLDVIRGFALSGILLTNVFTLLGVFAGGQTSAHVWLNLLIQQRFFPVFSFLFGISFALVVRSAQRRGLANPRGALVRRLGALLVLGLVHTAIYPGEALLPYAIFGFIVLVPLTFLPERLQIPVPIVLGAVLLILGLESGGMALIPGLFALGFGLAHTNFLELLEDSPRFGLLLTAVAAVIAVPMIMWQMRDPLNAGFSTSSAVAGFFTAAAYIGLMATLLHTPLRRALVAFFTPLGRMALTNYVSATIVLSAIGIVMHLTHFWVGANPIAIRFTLSMDDFISLNSTQTMIVWLGCIVLLGIQWAISTIWLRNFGQGPLERVWRRITWGKATSAKHARA